MNDLSRTLTHTHALLRKANELDARQSRKEKKGEIENKVDRMRVPVAVSTY